MREFLDTLTLILNLLCVVSVVWWCMVLGVSFLLTMGVVLIVMLVLTINNVWHWRRNV